VRPGATPDGSRIPFNAEGVFVRVLPASGDPVEVVGRQDRLGHYVATVTVPTGGWSGGPRTERGAGDRS